MVFLQCKLEGKKPSSQNYSISIKIYNSYKCYKIQIQNLKIIFVVILSREQLNLEEKKESWREKKKKLEKKKKKQKPREPPIPPGVLDTRSAG